LSKELDNTSKHSKLRINKSAIKHNNNPESQQILTAKNPLSGRPSKYIAATAGMENLAAGVNLNQHSSGR